jgi:hypothetical protein
VRLEPPWITMQFFHHKQPKNSIMSKAPLFHHLLQPALGDLQGKQEVQAIDPSINGVSERETGSFVHAQSEIRFHSPYFRSHKKSRSTYHS